MKKIYSYVLMAAALLIGTNVWANPISVSSEQGLRDAIYNAGPKTTAGTVKLQLTSDIVLTQPIWLHTTDIEVDAKSIELDLNGKDITMYGTGTEKGDIKDMFIITHGELFVINNNMADTSKIALSGATYAYSTIFDVYGSYKSSRWKKNENPAENLQEKYILNEDSVNTRDENGDHFTHLVIGPRVKLMSVASQGSAILINELYGSDNSHYFGRGDSLNYNTMIYHYDDINGNGHGAGLAQGVRVDVWGDIDFANIQANASKCYGIKVNGMLGSSLGTVHKTDGAFVYGNPKYSDYQAHCNTYQEDHEADTIDAPFINIHKGANIVAAKTTSNPNSDNVAAVYGAGYAKWRIMGNCEGTTGLYTKSGVYNITDATIVSTFTGDHVSPSGSGTGAKGAGSALVTEQQGGYAGGTKITISGDTKVSATSGCAIEEKTTTGDGTQLELIKIEGGTIEGGEDGAISLSTTAAGGKTQVYGSTLEGNVYVEDTPVSPSTIAASGSNMTTVKGENGQTVVVINQSTVDRDNDVSSTVNNKTGNVIWGVTADTDEDITVNTTLDYLEINTDYNQKLIVKQGKTLSVGRVVLGEHAQILVEAGAKFIVTGNQGIVAYQPNNIVLESSAEAQATFLFAPAVTSNRHPKAMVKLSTKAKQFGEHSYIYERMAIPTFEGDKTTYSIEGGMPKTIGSDNENVALYNDAPSFLQAVWRWDLASNAWIQLAKFKDMESFKGYQLTNNTANGGLVYVFQGDLVGNVNGEYEFVKNDFHFFGNSYTADINLASFLNNLGNNIEKTVWLYDPYAKNFKTITPLTANGRVKYGDANETPITDIRSMQAFILLLTEGDNGSAVVNYASAIWENPKYNPSATPAPARQDEVAEDWVTIRVSSANGLKDEVILNQNEEYTDAFENGADAGKFMNPDNINLYATTNAGNQAIVVSDDLNNTILTFAAGDATEYTLQFADVEGHLFAIRDNVTGAVVTMSENAAYSFEQAANTTVPARFEVIDMAKLPTAIDNVEENAKAAGIYTITGQYMGRDFSELPAGVYIVNGVKVIK